MRFRVSGLGLLREPKVMRDAQSSTLRFEFSWGLGFGFRLADYSLGIRSDTQDL